MWPALLRTLVLWCALLGPLPAGATPLPPGVTLIPGHWIPGGQPDGNSVLFEGPEGLLLLDTGRHIAHGQRLIEAVRAHGRPLRWVVNSHWHLDHIGGNGLLRSTFPQARAMASEGIVGARSGFLARYRAQLAAQVATLPAGDAQRAAHEREISLIDNHAAQTPDVFVQRSGEQWLNGGRLFVGLERGAATAGDVWLMDPGTRVLAAGDLVTLPVPFFDTACAPRWSAALARLSAQPFEWLIPGHGPVLTREDFARYRSGFDGLLQCAASAAEAGQCINGWIEALGPLLPEAEQRPARAYLGYYLSEHLRAPPALALAHCPVGG